MTKIQNRKRPEKYLIKEVNHPLQLVPDKSALCSFVIQQKCGNSGIIYGETTIIPKRMDIARQVVDTIYSTANEVYQLPGRNS